MESVHKATYSTKQDIQVCISLMSERSLSVKIFQQLHAFPLNSKVTNSPVINCI